MINTIMSLCSFIIVYLFFYFTIYELTIIPLTGIIMSLLMIVIQSIIKLFDKNTHKTEIK